MIFGAVIRFILEFCRRRGMRVPDLSRLRRRQPVFGVTNRIAEGLAASADDYLRRRSTAGPEMTSNPPTKQATPDD